MHSKTRGISSLAGTTMLFGAAMCATNGCGGTNASHGDTGDISDPHVSSIEGQLQVMISDHDDLTTRRRYFLGTDKGAQFELLFDERPPVSAGATIRVTGTEIDAETWHVSSFVILQPGTADGV